MQAEGFQSWSNGPRIYYKLIGRSEFNTTKLSEYRGKYVILIFLSTRLLLCLPYWRLQPSAIASTNLKSPKSLVFLLTVSSPHLAWIQSDVKVWRYGDLNYPLLPISKKEISAAWQRVLDPVYAAHEAPYSSLTEYTRLLTPSLWSQ